MHYSTALRWYSTGLWWQNKSTQDCTVQHLYQQQQQIAPNGDPLLIGARAVQIDLGARSVACSCSVFSYAEQETPPQPCRQTGCQLLAAYCVAKKKVQHPPTAHYYMYLQYSTSLVTEKMVEVRWIVYFISPVRRTQRSIVSITVRYSTVHSTCDRHLAYTTVQCFSCIS